MGVGICEASKLLFDYRCGLPEPGAGFVMWKALCATRRVSTSVALAARSGGLSFVPCFRAALNTPAHMRLCVLYGVVAQGGRGWCFARRRRMKLV